MKHCAEALAKEPDLADTYLLHALQQVMLALRAAESDPAGTGTRQLAAEAMQVGLSCLISSAGDPMIASVRSSSHLFNVSYLCTKISSPDAAQGILLQIGW